MQSGGSMRNLLFVILCLGLGASVSACRSTPPTKNASGAEVSISCVTCAKKMSVAAVTRTWNGKTLPFCGQHCETRFVKNPERFPH